jgi:hypothetical protein
MVLRKAPQRIGKPKLRRAVFREGMCETLG